MKVTGASGVGGTGKEALASPNRTIFTEAESQAEDISEPPVISLSASPNSVKDLSVTPI